MTFYRWIFNALLFILRRKTIGARALVVQKNKVLLIQHTYTRSWFTIGGGVDKGESPEQAIRRELMEEAGIRAKSLTLFNVYYNQEAKRDDYIVFYICTRFTEHPFQDTREIKEKKWFDMDKLPQDISDSTRQRINEYKELIPLSDRW